jgi:protein subunit release factor A
MKKELLFSITKKDLKITWFKSGGGGGQKKNKTANACRIFHPDSGARVTAQERRERSQNLKNALHRLAEHPKFKVWVNRRVFEIDSQKTINEMVDELMRPGNLKTEIIKNGKWIEEEI